MCGMYQEATVRGNTTSAQDEAQRKKLREKLDEKKNYMSDEMYQSAIAHLSDPGNDANSFQERMLEFQGFSIAPPKDAPSLTDKLVRARRASETQRLVTGRGRRESFMSGGDYGPSITTHSALGGRY